MPEDYTGTDSESATGIGIGSGVGSGSGTGTGNTATITNVGAGECIPRTRLVTVSYSNGTSGSATLSVACGGAGVTPPALAVGAGGVGSGSFTVSHSSSGSGHTLSSALLQGGVRLAGDAVSVSVGNPCPLSVIGVDRVAGLTELDPTAALSGTFDAALGNGIVLLVEDPAKIVDGIVRQPRLRFADPAAVTVDGNKGIWKHAAIPGARTGQYLRVVLTKDGEVKAIIRAVFK